MAIDRKMLLLSNRKKHGWIVRDIRPMCDLTVGLGGSVMRRKNENVDEAVVTPKKSFLYGN